MWFYLILFDEKWGDYLDFSCLVSVFVVYSNVLIVHQCVKSFLDNWKKNLKKLWSLNKRRLKCFFLGNVRICMFLFGTVKRRGEIKESLQQKLFRIIVF